MLVLGNWSDRLPTNSLFDTPPLYFYCTAKDGTIGLMRGLRTQLIKKMNICKLGCPLDDRYVDNSQFHVHLKDKPIQRC